MNVDLITRRSVMGGALALVGGGSLGCATTGLPGSNKASIVENLPIENVQWVGVSVEGSPQRLKAESPTVYGLVIEDKRFNARLNERAKNALLGAASSQKRFRFITEGALSREDSDSYALTLVITGEFITVAEVTGADGQVFQEINARIRGQVMLVNVSKDPVRQRVVCSYPLRAAYRDRLGAGQSLGEQKKREIVAGILMGQFGSNADFVEFFKQRVPDLAVRAQDEWITVEPLRISPDAAKEAGLTNRQVQLAGTLSSAVIAAGISTAANIPIVPSSSDGAIQEVSLSFAGRGGMAFKNPDPSKSLDVLTYVLSSESAQAKGLRTSKFITMYLGGFEMNFSSIDPDDKKKKPLVSLRLRRLSTTEFYGNSVNDRKINQGDQFVALITAFSEDLSNNLIPANQKWLEQSKAGSEKKSVREMVKLIRDELPRPHGE